MDTQQRAIAQMAVGRILRLMSRPFQPGDVEQYEDARHAILGAMGNPDFIDTRPNWARDRLCGAAGQ